MLSIYCAKVDATSKSASIAQKHNLKSKLASQIYRAVKKNGYFTAHQIFVQLYLLRPQWLAMLVISSIMHDMTGLSIRNPTSLTIFTEKLQDKQVILAEKTTLESGGDSDLHVACR